jgi:hypothetical protein
MRREVQAGAQIVPFEIGKFLQKVLERVAGKSPDQSSCVTAKASSEEAGEPFPRDFLPFSMTKNLRVTETTSKDVSTPRYVHSLLSYRQGC